MKKSKSAKRRPVLEAKTTVTSTPATDVPRRGPGRQTKLTRELIAGFADVLRATATPIITIVEAAGVPRSTFYQWLKKGESAKSGVYKELADTVTTAKAQGEQATLSQMRLLGMQTKDWRQMAWELERTRPKKYGQRVRVHVEEELTTVWNLLKTEFQDEPEIWERVARVIAGEVSPDGPDEDDVPASPAAAAEDVQPPTAAPGASDGKQPG